MSRLVSRQTLQRARSQRMKEEDARYLAEQGLTPDYLNKPASLKELAAATGMSLRQVERMARQHAWYVGKTQG